MNPAQSHAQVGAPKPPMYHPTQIRALPFLSDEEKTKYEQGLMGLWTRMNNSPPHSPDQNAARAKIIEFSKMLIGKIQARRHQQAQAANAGQQGGQRPGGQPPQRTPSVGGPGDAQAAMAAAQQQGVLPGASATPATTAAIQRPRVPDHLLQHVAKMTFRPPSQLAEKSQADATKWVEDMKDRYARALMTMENSKNKIAAMDKLLQDRQVAGNPLKDDDLRKYQASRAQQAKFHADAQKWVESVRRQQEMLGNQVQVGLPATPGAPANQQPMQNTTNAAVDAAKAQQLAAARAVANGTPNMAQKQQQATPNQAKQQPIQPNTQAPNPTAARVQTPQAATPTTGPNATRALSHSAAMSLANQRAASGPNAAGTPTQGGTSTPTNGAASINQGANTAQPGHSHAHPQPPAQQQVAPLQSKMPIQKQLPERATAVPQGVAVSSGVTAGRPTMSQGSGTAGGVLNQPAMSRIPAYNNTAQGQHVLSKKKLEELVRQVCGAPPEGQDSNLLTPEVEEVRAFPSVFQT